MVVVVVVVVVVVAIRAVNVVAVVAVVAVAIAVVGVDVAAMVVAMNRCCCLGPSYWHPPEVDPDCPEHGYDEETGLPHPRWGPEYNPDEEEDA